MEVSDEGNGSYRLLFCCPGCDMPHGPRIGPMEPNWEWNGDMNAPTFSPSIKVTYDHMSAEGRGRCAEFHLQHGRQPTRDEVPYDQHDICHSFVKDGVIEFLGDCTHALRGQTVPIPPFSWGD